MTAIKCVSFDVDDTLWDFTAMMQAGMDTVAGRMHEQGYTDVTPDGLMTRYWALCVDHDPAAAPWTELRRRMFEAILAEHGHAAPNVFSHELISQYVGVWKANVALYPGVYETFDALQEQGIKIAWATNGNFGPDEVVAEFPPYFDVVAMPHLVGASKPDAAFLEFVAEGAGCTPQEVIHVGDSLRSDVGGALAAGAVAVWFNPHEMPVVGDPTPDHVINHLTEVLDLL